MIDLIGHLIFAISTAAEIGVILSLYRIGLASTWRSLVVYESLHLAIDSTLESLYLLHYPRAEGILYWSTIHIFSAIQFWILLQIVFALFGWVRSRRTLAVCIVGGLSFAICIGTIMAFTGPNVFRPKLGNLLLTADRACMFAWCIFLVLAILSSTVAGIRWTHVESSIVVAFGVISISYLTSAEVVSRYGLKVWSSTWTVNSAVYMLATLFLILALLRPSINLEGISITDIKRAIEHQQDRLQAHRERMECI